MCSVRRESDTRRVILITKPVISYGQEKDGIVIAVNIRGHFWHNRIGGVMVSVLASNVVDHGFEPRSGQTTDYEIGICCFSAKHAALRRKSKDWLTRNQDNVSEWGDMSIRRLLFQWASTIKMQLSVLVWCKADLTIIPLKFNFFSSWYSWKIPEVALSNNHPLICDTDIPWRLTKSWWWS